MCWPSTWPWTAAIPEMEMLHLLQALLALGILLAPLALIHVLIEWFERRRELPLAQRPESAPG